jgi:hypothetical protein
MNDDPKVEAFSTWHELLVNSEARMGAQDQYDELLRLADNFREKGIIGTEERKILIQVATLAYTRSVEDLSRGDLSPASRQPSKRI